ncbi:MAG: RHS repeat-associated core domain-containing protein, partial [Acidobacteria bacterium]
IVANSTDAKVAYLTNDYLGSPRINTDANGNVTARHDYHPFGEEIGTLAVMPGSPQPRTAALGYQSDSVRQKFTGYERDNETELDFAQARMYNPRHGRFTSVDPLLASANVAKPQTFNRYTYVLNNPLALVDRTGAFPEFTFFVYVRAFAPFEWFGPGNIARVDNRGFSTDPEASYRIQAFSIITAANDGRYFPMSMTRASEPSISETNLGFISWTARSECNINDPSGSYYPDVLLGGNDSLGYHMYGNNDAIPLVSPDIDLHVQFRFNYVDQGDGVVDMRVTGVVTGDQFPAAEAFIRDFSGNSVMLGVFAPTVSSGPVMSLPGNGTLPMIDVNVTVRVKNGVFQGVVENGNVIPLEEYNGRFTSQPRVRKN